METAFSKLDPNDRRDKLDKSLTIQTNDLFQLKEAGTPQYIEENEIVEKKPTRVTAFSQLDSNLDEDQQQDMKLKDRNWLQTTGAVIGDIIEQPVGGLVDAGESILNLLLPEKKEIEISHWVDEPETIVGKFIRPASQFIMPWGTAYKASTSSYLFLKNASQLKKASEVALKAKVKLKKVKEITQVPRLTKVAIGGGAGFAIDFAAFAPNAPNLADLMIQYPATKNVLTEWLATDANGDPGMERLKNALTGLLPGVVLPEFIRGVSKGFTYTAKTGTGKVKSKLDIIEDRVIKREAKEISKKSYGKTDAEKDAIANYVKSKRTKSEKVAMWWRENMYFKKHIINFLDNVRGIKYLEDAARGLGISAKGLAAKSKELNAYQEARFLPAIGGMIEHFLLKNTFIFKNSTLTSTKRLGLQPLLEKNLGKNADVNDFFNYMGAKSILSLDTKTFKGLFKDTKAAKIKWQKIATDGDKNANYVKTLNEMDQFNKDLLQIAVDAQLISQKTMNNLLTKRKHYLPLYRDLSDDALLMKKTGSNKLRMPLKAKVPIGTGKDELPLANFFDNYIENVQGIITASYKNHVKRMTFDIIDAAKGKLSNWAVPVSAVKPKKVSIKPEELKRQINKADDSIELDLNSLDDLDEIALFRSERIQLKDSHEVVFRTDKKGNTVQHVYRVDNNLLKLTLDSISPKQYLTTNGAVKVARWAKNLLTRMVTYDPGFFAYANAIRDTFSAAILSMNRWHLPVLSTANSVRKRLLSNEIITLADGSRMSYKDLYEEFLFNGGSFASTLLKGETSDRILSNLYRKMGHNDYKLNVLNTPMKMRDGYEKLVTGFENASRFTEYALLRKTMSARQAAFGAREVAVDFGMHGANHIFRQYTSTVPFLNAGLQGLYRTARALNSSQRTAVVAKLGAFVVAPTTILYAINRNNPDYWKQSQQIRDLNFMLPLGGNNWLKFPKPFEFGAIGTIAESTLELFDKTGKHESFFDTLYHVIKHQTRLSWMPQVAAPIYQQYVNKNFFGSPILPEGMKHNIPDFGQSYPWSNNLITSAIESAPPEIRKHLMSPIRFEALIRGYTGAIGGFVLDLLDEGSYLFSDFERPERRWDEMPLFKRFLQLDPSKYTQAESEFYELKKRAIQAVNQAKKFSKEMKFELLDEFLKTPENQELLSISPKLEYWGRQIQDLNRRRNQIYEHPDLSSERKRELINELEQVTGTVFDQIMDNLLSEDLDIFKPIFDKEPKGLDWLFPNFKY